MIAIDALPANAPVYSRHSTIPEVSSRPPSMLKSRIWKNEFSIPEKLGQIAKKIISTQTGNTTLTPRVLLLVNDQKTTIQIEIVEGSLETNKEKTKALQFKESLELLQNKLKLSVTQLSDIFGVTRKSIYDWMDGAEPRANSIQRAQLLVDIINSSETDLSKLKNVWSIPFSDTSFKSIVLNEKLEYTDAKNLALEKIKEIYPHLAPREANRSELNFIGNSHTADIERAT